MRRGWGRLNRLLQSTLIPLVLVGIAGLMMLHGLLLRPSIYTDGRDGRPLSDWGSAYRAVWSPLEAAEPIIAESEGDLSLADGSDTNLLNSGSREEDPALSPDGAAVLFASDRGGDQGFDLYWSLREGRGFSPPRAFPGPLNSVFHERSPSIAILPPGGLPGPSGAGESLLLYTSNRLTGLGDDHDLFIARGLLGGEWEAPERIEELSSAADERSAAIFPDGGGIIFLREGRDGIELLESSRLPGGGWSAPRPLEGITPPSTAARLRLEDGGTRLVIAAEEASWESRLRLLRLLPQPPAVTMPAWVLLALALLLLLLRLLAIRWHGLELLYRCLLLSLLIHILLWLWFHDRGIRAPAPGSGPPSEEAVIPMELAIDLSASEPVEVAEAAHGENVTVAERPAETPEEEAYRLTPRESAPQQPAATSPSLGAAAVDLPEIARQEETVPIDSPERRAEEAGSEEAELRRAEMATAARVEQAEAQMSAAQAEAAGSEYIGRQAAPAALPAPRRPSGEGRGVALADVTPPVMRPDLAPERSEAPPTPASRAPADVAELRDARAAGGREARAIEASGRESSPAEARWSRRARTRGGAARRPDSPGPAALVASPPTARAGNAPATPPASAPPVSAPAREISRTDAPAAGLREGGATGRRRERDGEVAAARPAAEAMSIGAPRPAARGRASPPAREPAVDLPATVARGAPSETSGSPSRRSEGGPERADGAEARIASPPPRADPAVVARGELPAAPEPRAPLRRERARGEASPRAREAARQGTEGEPAALARSSRRQGAPRELPIGEASLPAAPATRLTPPASRGPAGVAREQAAAGASSPTVTPKLPGPSAARTPSRELATAPALTDPRDPRSSRRPRQRGSSLPPAEGGTDGRSGPAPRRARRAAEDLPDSALASATTRRGIPAVPLEAPAPRPEHSSGSPRVLTPRPEVAARARPPTPDALSRPPRAAKRELARRSEAQAPRERAGEPRRGGPAPVARGPSRAPAARSPGRRLPAPPPRRLPSTPRLGSLPPAEVSAREPSPPAETVPWVSARLGARKWEALRQHGGDEKTERAVQKGLAYLDSRQRRHGGWGVLAVRDEKYGEVVVGRSALALLAFLGAGHYPGSGSRYEGVTRRAIDFLVTMQLPNGHFGARSSAYSHGIATYALGEALLLSKDESLRRPLKRAVEQILRHQQLAPYDRRHRGGWSYFYQDGHKYDEYPRVSVTVWQLMALETARMGGIEVPAERLELAQGYLLSSWEDRMGRFLYNRDPERLASAYPTLPGSTPAAAFVLQVLGNDADIVQIRRALWMLAQHPPRRWAPADTRGFILRGQGNPYYWYYGTLALFVHGGDEWTVWNEALKDVLLPSQDDDGSWTPISVYANTYARDTDFDRSYTTALNVLMLEVYYRYLTPFQQAALEER